MRPTRAARPSASCGTSDASSAVSTRASARVDPPGSSSTIAIDVERRRRVALGDDRVHHPRQPEPLAVLGREDAHAAFRERRDLVGHDHAAATAVDADVARALLGEPVGEVREVLDVAALVRRHRDRRGVFLHDRLHDVVDAAVVPEVDDLGALRLEDAPHDVDRGVVAVEEAGRGDDAHRVRGDVQLLLDHGRTPSIPDRALYARSGIRNAQLDG